MYNLNGTLMLQKERISTARYKFESKLAQGTYFAIIETRDGIIHRKKIVVL
ncbi:T9SS type A sorting domain-containing protein [Brumimicrobium oceani]|nr:T9SS type A sorting domain-containing protein [Brumimicrobium oceani]